MGIVNKIVGEGGGGCAFLGGGGLFTSEFVGRGGLIVPLGHHRENNKEKGKKNHRNTSKICVPSKHFNQV